MTTPSLPPALLARDQQALVMADEAKAQQAATDAQTSALTLAQNKYKALVPDLTKAATSTVDDKSTGVAFSGLVTYSALYHAAEIIANRIATAVGEPVDGRPATILVTSQSDLVTNDLLSGAVAASLSHLIKFAGDVLAEPQETGTPEPPETVAEPADRHSLIQAHVEMLTTASLGATASLGGAAVAGAAGAAGLGPIGLGAAAVAAIPSIISLFSSTTTVKDHAEDITDLATTTSVVSAVADKLTAHTVVHEDFRRSPVRSSIVTGYQKLADQRTKLVFRQEHVQRVKNDADLKLSAAQQEQDAAKKANPSQPENADLAQQVDDAQKASADAAASLSLVDAAVKSIDDFTSAVNATAAGARSPLATAVLNELLYNQGRPSGADDIGYVLSVKGLGGQSVEYSKDRHVGFDTYTTLADAPVAYMLYDLAARKIVSSGIANGVSSVHGHLGEPPKGMIGPNAADAVQDETSDTDPEDQQAGPREHWWNRWRQIF